MAQHDIRTAVLIGAGNLGWHLGQALNQKGVRVLQVISKSVNSGKKLSGILKCDYSTDLKSRIDPVGVIIIAVPDTEIPGVINQTEFGNNLVVHTAGSVPMEVFEDGAVHYGVFYPLMTFTREKPVNFSAIPLLVEANTYENTEKIRQLAERLSGKVCIINSARRKLIHLAAVIASNFSNHMYTIAESLLFREGISFDLLKPLILETTDKIGRLSPLIAQTGPAVRNDTPTLEAHLQILADNPQVAEIYRLISKSIINFAAKEQK
jgi:predicted short-subunit dehydrogenase-like oxidoreductase (DUF2520 family)